MQPTDSIHFFLMLVIRIAIALKVLNLKRKVSPHIKNAKLGERHNLNYKRA